MLYMISILFLWSYEYIYIYRHIYIHTPKDTTYSDRNMFLCTICFVDLLVIYLRKMQKLYVLLQMNDIALHKSETTHVGSVCIHYMVLGESICTHPKKFQLPHKQLRGSRHNFLLIWSTAMWYNCGISQLRLRDEASAISNLGQVQWILLPFTSNRNSFGNLFSMRTLNTIENKSSASAINKNQEMCKPKFSDCPACRTWPNTCVEKPSLIYLGNFQ